MIAAYGYRRKAAPLVAAGADPGAVWIDTAEDRAELRALLDTAGTSVRKGDTLLVRSMLDLGRWRRGGAALLKRHGVEIRVIGGGRERPTNGRGRGRPALVAPASPEDAKALLDIWESSGGHAYVEREAGRLLGVAVRWWNVRDWYLRECAAGK